MKFLDNKSSKFSFKISIILSFIILISLIVYEQINIQVYKISGNLQYANSNNDTYCEDFILAVWHDYETQQASDKNGGSGRTTRFYTSIDGVNFEEFNKDIYPLKVNSKQNGGTVNNGGIGAPSIVYYNGLFFMVCSGNGVTPTRDASIAVSKDFVNWKWFDYGLNIASKDNVSKVAAPQLVVLDNKMYLIESVWCGQTQQDINDSTVYVYDSYMTQVEYKEEQGFSFGTPWLLEVYKEDGTLSPNRNHIDSTIVQSNGKYYLFTKDDTNKNIELFISSDLHTWELKNKQLFGADYLEGPTVCYYNNEWHIYADRYANTRGMNKQIVHCTTKDFETFENYSLINAPHEFQCRHGDVITINDPEAKKILQNVLDFNLSDEKKEFDNQNFNLNGLKTVLYSKDGTVLAKKCTDFVAGFNTTYQITSNYEYKITDLSNPFGLSEVVFEFSEKAKNATLIVEASNGKKLNFVYSPKDNGTLKVKFKKDPNSNTLYPEVESQSNIELLKEIPGIVSQNTVFKSILINEQSQKAKVEIITTVEGYELQYSTDRTNWLTYKEPIELEKDSKIYVCLSDGENRGSYKQYNVTVDDTDKETPVDPDLDDKKDDDQKGDNQDKDNKDDEDQKGDNQDKDNKEDEEQKGDNQDKDNKDDEEPKGDNQDKDNKDDEEPKGDNQDKDNKKDDDSIKNEQNVENSKQDEPKEEEKSNNIKIDENKTPNATNGSLKNNTNISEKDLPKTGKEVYLFGIIATSAMCGISYYKYRKYSKIN